MKINFVAIRIERGILKAPKLFQEGCMWPILMSRSFVLTGNRMALESNNRTQTTPNEKSREVFRYGYTHRLGFGDIVLCPPHGHFLNVHF